MCLCQVLYHSDKKKLGTQGSWHGFPWWEIQEDVGVGGRWKDLAQEEWRRPHSQIDAGSVHSSDTRLQGNQIGLLRMCLLHVQISSEISDFQFQDSLLG